MTIDIRNSVSNQIFCNVAIKANIESSNGLALLILDKNFINKEELYECFLSKEDLIIKYDFDRYNKNLNQLFNLDDKTYVVLKGFIVNPLEKSDDYNLYKDMLIDRPDQFRDFKILISINSCDVYDVNKRRIELINDMLEI